MAASNRPERGSSGRWQARTRPAAAQPRRAAGAAPLEAAGAAFERLFGARVVALQPEDVVDPKTQLQHWAQGVHRITPVYVRIDAAGGEGPRWRARVELRFPDGQVRVLGIGEGESLRVAERMAAAAALAARDG